jgi:hypothetical protein
MEQVFQSCEFLPFGGHFFEFLLGRVSSAVVGWLYRRIVCTVGLVFHEQSNRQSDLFMNAGGEVAAARAPKGEISGAGGKPELPVCEQAETKSELLHINGFAE